MRIAPIPLYMAARHIGDKKYVVKTCCEAAALTHGHPLGWLSAGAFGCLLYDIMENFSLHYAVEDTANFMKEHYGNHPDTARLIELLNAAKYAADIRGHHSNYYTMCEPECECLGEGWVGEEALAIGLYCAMAAVGMGFENCILNSVTHKGDSDSTGLIAGNIFGAYFGDRVIPEKWLKPLEFRSVLEELSADMAQGCRIAEDENYHDLAWKKKYVECVPYQRDPEREPMIFKTYLYGEPGCGIHEIEMPHTTPVSKADGSVEFVKTTVKHYLKEESVWQEGESQRDGWVKFEKTQFGMDISGWYKWFSFHLVYDPCYQKIYILNSDMAEREETRGSVKSAEIAWKWEARFRSF